MRINNSSTRAIQERNCLKGIKFVDKSLTLILIVFHLQPFYTFIIHWKGKRRKKLLKQILGEGVNTSLRNFLLLLVDRRRIAFLEPILQQYLVLLRQLNQTVLAEITSAVPLTQTQQQAITEKVITLTKARQVELATKIDSDLIGGVIIKVGSQVIDASLRGQLRRLSLRLSSN